MNSFRGMVGDVTDPLGANAAHAKEYATYEWLTDEENAAIVKPRNPEAATAPHHLAPTATAVLSSDKVLCESHYADQDTAKLRAELRDPRNPDRSLMDHTRLHSNSGKGAHEHLCNPTRGARTADAPVQFPGPLFRTALQYRFGVPLSIERKGSMCACGKHVFTTEHALGCVAGGHLTRRHEDLITVFFLLARACGLAASRNSLKHLYPAREEANLAEDEKAHYIPDLVIYDYPLPGHALVCDVSVIMPTGTTAQSLRRNTAAYSRHNEKEKKVAKHLAATISESGMGAPTHHVFAPLVFEPFGACTRAVTDLIKGLCAIRSVRFGHQPVEDAIFRHTWMQRIASALHMANARQCHHLATDTDKDQYTPGYIPRGGC
jgi:hypothetical protein